MAPAPLVCLLFCLPLVMANNIITDITAPLTTKTEEVVGGVVEKVESTVVGVLSSQCQLIKKLLHESYEDYQDDEPDYSQLSLVHISKSGVTTKFYLNSTETPANVMHILDLSQKVFLYFPGFGDDPSKESFEYIRTPLYNAGFNNVLGFDSSSLTGSKYLRASTLVQPIGERLARTLVAMCAFGLKPEEIHGVAHSLGAHVAGFTGKSFYKLTGKKIYRLTGLDPAQPCYTAVNGSYRLNPTDAVFVDVTHTNAGILGINVNCGHVDFYPNGGSSQPGCDDFSCNHARSRGFFNKSIMAPTTAFKAVKCKDWHQFTKGECSNEYNYMGFRATPQPQGQFYLITGQDPPYGLGEDGTTYTD